ncbi:hypothetical protein N7494_005376 [Penicillium frequentans]|uniref:Uncharacterized protein n=1 Tax=Penicillium frequentans TaxID=3151616 RepID=A0AAD6GHD3_9EURO|nr:hypothetical protein N7494_005376 [Penicillium glabrum]
MFGGQFLQHKISAAGRICIVSKCKDAGCWKKDREEGLSISGRPCYLEIALQAMKEYYAEREILEDDFKLGA